MTDYIGGDGDDAFSGNFVAGDMFHGGKGKDSVSFGSILVDMIDLNTFVFDSIETIQAPAWQVKASPDLLNSLDALDIGFGELIVTGGGTVNLSGDQLQLLSITLSDTATTLDLSNAAVRNYSSTQGPYIHGGAGNDTITGSESPADYIYGGGGDDVLWGGRSGSDLLDGQEGNDRLIYNSSYNNHYNLTGGEGVDTLDCSSGENAVTVTLSSVAGTPGSVLPTGFDGLISNSVYSVENVLGTHRGDVLNGNNSANVLDGADGVDILNGFGGDDTLIGGLSNDQLFGGTGIDNLTGGSGDDRLDGGAGADAMNGGTGNDFYVVDDAGDTITEGVGEGTDQVESSITFSLSGLNVEKLFLTGIVPIDGTGNALDNEIEGNDAANTLSGGEGVDILRGRGGNDTLIGGAGPDQLIGGDNNDTYILPQIIVEAYDIDTIVELPGQGTDLVKFAGYNYTLPANVENLTFTQGFNTVGTGNGEANVIDASAAGGSRLYGLDGNDTLIGSNSGDVLDGGAGADIMRGGLGSDTYKVDNLGDQVFEDDDPTQFNIVIASVDYTLAFGIVQLSLVGSGITGTGNARGNLLFSSGGNTLAGGLGDDYYVIKATDTVIEAVGGGFDSVVVDGDFTLADGLEIEVLALNSPAGGTLTGNAFGQEINSGTGDDTLLGMGGDDLLDGGQGVDRLYGGMGDDGYFVDRQDDLLFENAGEGTDTVTATSSFYLYANLENLVLYDYSGDLFGVGNELSNIIIGNFGSNLLLGGGGDDVVHGGDDVDSIFGQDGNDQLFGDAGIDYLVGGNGNDMLDGGDDADALYGEDGNDTLTGGTGFVTDILVGGNGDDILHGDSGLADYDLMNGGDGNDSYYVDTGDDLTFEAVGGGTDTVYANVAGANSGVYLYANVENLVLQGTTTFGVGNELANNLTGNASVNLLLGGLGDDVLNGKGGNDVLFGEGGADTFVFEHGTGGDVIGDFLAGTDKIDLHAFGFADFQAVINAMHEVNGTTAIDLGNGDFIVINGVANAALHAADFVL